MKDAQSTTALRHLRRFVAVESTSRLPDQQLLERFAGHHEEAAFEALVKRHGALVLGVCRLLLPNWHDAEDAFQATFWVLARKAGTVGKQGSLGGWLYQVAYHAAIKIRARAANRLQQESKVGQRPTPDPLAEVTGRELVATLDEELHHLPEQFRVPLVLCYLEGNTRDEAARQLGWSLGTLKRRLEQGKEKLRRRLEQRGLALPAVFLAAGATEGAARAAVPSLLAATTARSAAKLVGGNTGTALGTPLGAITEQVLQTLFPSPFKIAGAVLGLVALAALAVIALAQRSAEGKADTGPKADAAPQKPVATPRGQAQAKAGQMHVTGRVLDTQGKPIGGARVAVIVRPKNSGRGGDFAADRYRVLGQGRADAGGRFHLTAGRTSSVRHRDVTVLAKARGYALGWQSLNPDADTPQGDIKLMPEEPIRGRLVDLQGQPAAGVRVYVNHVGRSVSGMLNGVSPFFPQSEKLPLWPEPAITNHKGRFVVAGLNRSAGVGLEIQDERFAPYRIYLDGRGPAKDLAASLAPAQRIEGNIAYADTGKPVPNARLTVYSSNEPYGGGGGLDGRADGQGHFRLNPYAGKYFTVAAYTPDGKPYLTVRKQVQWAQGAVKQRLNLKLPRGVLIQGTVLEAVSGKPLAGASVQYIPRNANNPNYREDVVTGWEGIVVTGTEGVFRITALPGPGHLLVSGPTLDFIHAEIGANMIYSGTPGGIRFSPDAVVKLDFSPKISTQKVTVRLHRGVTVKGKLVRPDGKPVAEALMMCRLHVNPLSLFWRFPQKVRDGRFELHGCDPKASYPVYFLDAKNKWGASVTLAAKQAGKPLIVRLLPCGKATARLVDPTAKPWVNVFPWLEILITPGPDKYDRRAEKQGMLAADGDYLPNIDRLNYWRSPFSDAKGRLTLTALIPGATYRIVDQDKDGKRTTKDFQVQAGKTLDLGDVVLKRGQ
jgi:RNA polymerase sigma factor (sigma-70 family)